MRLQIHARLRNALNRQCLFSTWIDSCLIYQIAFLKYPNQLLRREAEHLVENEMVPLLKSGIIERMFHAMYQGDGVGLAAPQIGVNKRFFISNHNGKNDPSTGKIYINPVIISKSPKMIRSGEACLSIPKIEGTVERHYSILINSIIIDFASLKTGKFDLNYREVSLKGYSSQIFQHEMDHLNGILFTDKLYYIADKIKTKYKLLTLENSTN